MGWESFGVVRFHLRPLLPGQTKIAKLKVLITRVLLVLEVWDGKPTYRKSCAGILLVWSDLTWTPPSRSIEDSQTYNCLELAYYWSYRFGMVNKLQEIMGWEFFCVVGFDLGPLRQGQTRIAKLKKCL